MEILSPGVGLTEARQRIADVCGVTRQAVEHWERDGVPGKHVLTLETASNCTVSARDILEWSEGGSMISAPLHDGSHHPVLTGNDVSRQPEGDIGASANRLYLGNKKCAVLTVTDDLNAS